ncbi:hypothetical protein A2372_01160 [Candidatus Wolfebacteria bacterium RIFOXYB1_FULL_54_12]|uniref:Uncharacterized protein n=1 Tax=Candidatus Wolfebacteria bacterium RIFOXYB1_FULL_54_12 TaxID=1802559 RepID=A0A1F8DXH7_9BACT|nr:MAG: hypothetical protein A2372_01160 [Candidatus Wolfebacteria bacterium RIFOXYB1_FULL_54_12]
MARVRQPADPAGIQIFKHRLDIHTLDSRFHGNDKMLDSRPRSGRGQALTRGNDNADVYEISTK